MVRRFRFRGLGTEVSSLGLKALGFRVSRFQGFRISGLRVEGFGVSGFLEFWGVSGFRICV